LPQGHEGRTYRGHLKKYVWVTPFLSSKLKSYKDTTKLKILFLKVTTKLKFGWSGVDPEARYDIVT
jgi:hypothetical protein